MSTAAPLTTLKTYVANVFFDVFIQADDDIAHQVYVKNWSKNVAEVDNGKPLNYDSFYTLLVDTRKALTNRYLVAQSAVVAPADPEGRTGQVAHTSHWTALSDGKEVKGTIVSVLKIGVEDGHRKVETESFVLDVQPL